MLLKANANFSEIVNSGAYHVYFIEIISSHLYDTE